MRGLPLILTGFKEPKDLLSSAEAFIKAWALKLSAERQNTWSYSTSATHGNEKTEHLRARTTKMDASGAEGTAAGCL